MIHKDGTPLIDLATWRDLAGPKRPMQWQDGRSAKESARAWLAGGGPAVPVEIRSVLGSHPHFHEFRDWTAEPERRVRFDAYRGEPANVDVLLLARDDQGSFAVAVEAKADESFGARLGDAVKAAERRLAGNPRSKGLARIRGLTKRLFDAEPEELGELADLRYQLLTTTAAALAAARSEGTDRAVLLIHEFVTSRTADRNHRRNRQDLHAFIHRLSRGRISSVEPGELKGPLPAPGDPGLRLYIGKAVRRVE